MIFSKRLLIVVVSYSVLLALDGIIITRTVNVRAKPSFKSKIVGVLDKGEILEGLELQGKWYRINDTRWVPYISVILEKDARKYIKQYLTQKINKFDKKANNLYIYYLKLAELCKDKDDILSFVDETYGDNVILLAALCLYHGDIKLGINFLNSAIKYDKDKLGKARFFLAYTIDEYFDYLIEVNSLNKNFDLPLLRLLLD